MTREGSRGHYLVAAFLADAAGLVRDAVATDRGSRLQMSSNPLAKCMEWDALSDAYEYVYGIFAEWELDSLPAELVLSDEERTREFVEENLGQWCHDAANDAEQVLADVGYQADWDDGYVIEDTTGIPWVASSSI